MLMVKILCCSILLHTCCCSNKLTGQIEYLWKLIKNCLQFFRYTVIMSKTMLLPVQSKKKKVDVAACCCMCFMLLHMCNPVASLLETRMTCLNPDSSYYYSVFAGCNAILKNFAALFLRGGEWTNRLTENVPILQDFVPYQGGCPASPP